MKYALYLNLFFIYLILLFFFFQYSFFHLIPSNFAVNYIIFHFPKGSKQCHFGEFKETGWRKGLNWETKKKFKFLKG